MSSMSVADITLLSDINKLGSRIKLENMAKTKVMETNKPRAWVPPKLEAKKMKKPAKQLTRYKANSLISNQIYKIMLTSVSSSLASNKIQSNFKMI